MADLMSTTGPIRKVTLTQVGAFVVGCTLALMLMGQTATADTLHGYCFAGPACSDNGTNTPTATDPPQFGFHGSGGTDTGDLWYVFLLPTAATDPASIGVTGTANGTAARVPGNFTSGQLDAFLGISASPTNPFGSFGAGGVTSYEVYKFDLGTETITGTTGPQETTSIGLPTDSYIVAFLNTGNATAPDWSATASSGAILETGTPTQQSTVPEPTSLILLGTGIVGAAGTIRRRRL